MTTKQSDAPLWRAVRDGRADPATLRAVAEHLRVTLLAEVREMADGLDALNADIAVNEAADMIENECASLESMADEASHVRALKSEAEARPPLLSDWVRACEGTGLGEPGCGQIDWPEHQVTIDGTGAVAMRHPPRGDADQIAASTPAELRAALNRLAEERSGLRSTRR